MKCCTKGLNPLLTVLVCLLFCDAAQAGVVISIDNVTLTAGGPSAFVNVWARWDDTDELVTEIEVDSFIATFSITGPANVGSAVEFVAYDDAGLIHNGDHHFKPSEYSDEYLFYGNSRYYENSEHVGTVGIPGNTVFSGGDLRERTTDPILDTVLLGSTMKLLFLLELKATGTDSVDREFSISFADGDVAMVGSIEDGLPYYDAVLDPIQSGLFTVSGGVAAVPEPSSCLCFLAGAAIWTVRSRRRKSEA